MGQARGGHGRRSWRARRGSERCGDGICGFHKVDRGPCQAIVVPVLLVNRSGQHYQLSVRPAALDIEYVHVVEYGLHIVQLPVGRSLVPERERPGNTQLALPLRTRDRPCDALTALDPDVQAVLSCPDLPVPASAHQPQQVMDTGLVLIFQETHLTAQPPEGTVVAPPLPISTKPLSSISATSEGA